MKQKKKKKFSLLFHEFSILFFTVIFGDSIAKKIFRYSSLYDHGSLINEDSFSFFILAKESKFDCKIQDNIIEAGDMVTYQM